MSRPWPLLLLAVLCLIRVGSGTGALGWGTVLPGFTCYRPLGAPARFLWPPFSAASRHRPPPAHRADACICRCHAIGYFFSVFIRRPQPLPGGGGPSNCFCMNHWNKKLTEVGAQHCRNRPDFWVAYKLMGNPKLASHCRGARVIRKRPPPTTRRPRRTPPTRPPTRRRRTPPTPPRRRTPPTRPPARRRNTPPTPTTPRRRTPPTPPRRRRTPPTPPRRRTPRTTPRRQKTPPTGYPKPWPKEPKHPPTRPPPPPPGKRSGGERGGPPPSSGTYGVYPSRPDGKVTYPCQPGSSHCPPGSYTVNPKPYRDYRRTPYPVYQEPYRGHSSQPPCDHCARSSSDRGPHVVHVFHHGAPTRPPSVQHVHINVHQNQLHNVQSRGGSGSDSGSGSGGGATAGAASNAVVNVHVNGQGGGPAGRGGTVVNNALGSRLETTAAGAGPGGQPSEAAAVQTASSESWAGSGEHRGVQKRAGPCGGAPGGCGSCCKY